LPEYAVHPFSPELAAAVYQLYIIWRYHYGGITTNMVRDLLIFHIVLKYLLFAVLPFAAYGFLLITPGKVACYPETIQAMLYTVLLVGAEVALGIAQIIDSIQQIGLSAAVCPGNAGYRRIEIKTGRGVISILK
jgi:hypothetical protein